MFVLYIYNFYKFIMIQNYLDIFKSIFRLQYIEYVVTGGLIGPNIPYT